MQLLKFSGICGHVRLQTVLHESERCIMTRLSRSQPPAARLPSLGWYSTCQALMWTCTRQSWCLHTVVPVLLTTSKVVCFPFTK